jgi:hypothetical protein
VPVVFRLAPMSRRLRVLTWGLLVVPLVLLATAAASPPRAQVGPVAVSALVVLVYASVWLVWRPRRFEIDATTLRIVWPVRSRTIVRTAVVAARVVTGPEFRREYGLGMRIGAGGLFGGFGLLKMRTTTFSMWIARTDPLVIVELRDARPLLVTPEDPDRFVAMLGG